MKGALKLGNENWSLSVLPKMGASITSCEYLGFPVFEPARPAFLGKTDVFASSCFPLIPFSNRIANGRFSFAGEAHQIEPNHPNEKHPIHGNSWQKPWKVISQTANSCRLSLSYKPEPKGWPWAYYAEQLIAITDDILAFELSITNTDEHPFPAAIGLHPFFSDAQSAQIEFEAETLWEHDKDILPTHLRRLTSETDFSKFQFLKDRRLDNCFSGWNGATKMCWPSFNHVIEMRADPVFSNLVVYSQPETSFFCLEPVTHTNNALNLGNNCDMDIVNPGEDLSGEILFQGRAKEA